MIEKKPCSAPLTALATLSGLPIIAAHMNSEAQKLVLAGKLSAADGEKLSKLEPGVFCLHKSWGVGKIAEWDLLGDRLIIDFEGKPGHPLKLAFALSSLEVLPETHLLARRHSALPELQQMAKEKPAVLVEEALKCSGGKLSLDQLDVMLKGRIVPEGEYKKWWEGAKRALKTFRHIVVPAKRTDPLVLRDQTEKPGAGMVEQFIKARDMKGKLAALGAIAKDIDLFENPAAELAPALQNLSETVGKAFRLHLKESLHLLLARDELVDGIEGAALPAGSLKVADIVREARQQIAEAINNLPVGLLGRLYRAFPTAFPNRQWVVEALNHLTRTGGRAVAEIAAVLDENDELDVLAEFLKKAVRNRVLSTDLIIWLTKERKGLASSVFDIDLGHALLGALEDDHVKGGPKKTGRLQDIVSADRTLLAELVADADEDEVRLFARRLLASNVFDELTRRSLMARIIKARPEMEALMAEGAARQDEALIVSWDSLEKKKQELEEIINVKIPQNKRDIQIAREYGDLRENFEYKSAKQQQAVLLRMQAKYERDMRHARGTDFSDAQADKAGIGTIVEIEDTATGARDTYTILGAWDGDVEKNIIAYLSETAKALIGKAAGEEAEVPTENHGVTRKVKVASIRIYAQPSTAG